MTFDVLRAIVLEILVGACVKVDEFGSTPPNRLAGGGAVSRSHSGISSRSSSPAALFPVVASGVASLVAGRATAGGTSS